VYFAGFVRSQFLSVLFVLEVLKIQRIDFYLLFQLKRSLRRLSTNAFFEWYCSVLRQVSLHAEDTNPSLFVLLSQSNSLMFSNILSKKFSFFIALVFCGGGYYWDIF